MIRLNHEKHALKSLEESLPDNFNTFEFKSSLDAFYSKYLPKITAISNVE